MLHGEIVAYGILVKLVLEEKFDELESSLLFYQSINLPYTLTDIGLTINQQAEMLHINFWESASLFLVINLHHFRINPIDIIMRL